MPAPEDLIAVILRMLPEVAALRLASEAQGNHRIARRAEETEIQLFTRLAELTEGEESLRAAMATAVVRSRRRQRDEQEDPPPLH